MLISENGSKNYKFNCHFYNVSNFKKSTLIEYSVNLKLSPPQGDKFNTFNPHCLVIISIFLIEKYHTHTHMIAMMSEIYLKV